MSNAKNSEAQRRQRHIKEMREKLERSTGQPSTMFLAEDGDSEFEESFLEQILAFEGVDEVSLFDELEKGGTSLPAPEALDEEQLHVKLWEVIRGMARLGHYLYSTDHLSDRELYGRLWNDLLREPTSVLPSNPNFACHIDILGGWSEEDTYIYLKHYADDEERRRWAKEWPEDTVPAHEDPQYDRDRHLPGVTRGAEESQGRG